MTVENGLQVPLVAPAIALNGRQSKVLVTNYSFGQKGKVQYSTAEVFFSGTIDGRDVLFLRGDSNQPHEVALQLTGQPISSPSKSPFVKLTRGDPRVSKETTIVSFLVGFPSDLLTVWDSSSLLILFADTTTAAAFWSPSVTTPGSGDPFNAFWGIGTNTSVLVGGPYLVRSAQINDNVLALTGDLEKDVELQVVAPKSVKKITWNGDDIHVSSSSSSSVLSGQVKPKNNLSAVKIPKLTGWKFKDSLPEVQPGFDDSNWVEANKATTNIPYPQYYGDGRILYGCDYGL